MSERSTSELRPAPYTHRKHLSFICQMMIMFMLCRYGVAPGGKPPAEGAASVSYLHGRRGQRRVPAVRPPRLLYGLCTCHAKVSDMSEQHPRNSSHVFVLAFQTINPFESFSGNCVMC